VARTDLQPEPRRAAHADRDAAGAQDSGPRGQTAVRRDGAQTTDPTENAPHETAHVAAHASRDTRRGVTAPVRATPRIDDAVPVDATARDTSARDQDARDALRAAGYKPSQARAAVEQARPHVGSDDTLEQLIREALRCCAR
jgi:hypothetical protein